MFILRKRKEIERLKTELKALEKSNEFLKAYKNLLERKIELWKN